MMVFLFFNTQTDSVNLQFIISPRCFALDAIFRNDLSALERAFRLYVNLSVYLLSNTLHALWWPAYLISHFSAMLGCISIHMPSTQNWIRAQF